MLVKSGETDLPMIANEYLFTAVLTAVFGCVLFGLIPLLNKERVPYTAGDKISFKDMMGALKSNKPFMLVIISYFLGFGRQMAMGIQVQAANILLGSQNLVAVLGISTAIGTSPLLVHEPRQHGAHRPLLLLAVPHGSPVRFRQPHAHDNDRRLR